jgi:class 3 adenylate cyclase
MTPDPLILAVDDLPQNVRLLDAVLSPRGFRVATATSGAEALDALSREHPDLVLLDIRMPGMDGYEVCRRIREDPNTAFLPVVMITASEGEERIRAIESGADDFVPTPYDQAELLARVRSLVRIKHYHDEIERQAAELKNQAAELARWNRELEQRVQDQVEQLERVGRLRRFLPAQVADRMISSGDHSFLNAHRREITVVCCDLRRFTAFAGTADPEYVWQILGEYNSALGELVSRHEGTLERFTGDGVVVFFNDPNECDDPPFQSVRMALQMLARVQELAEAWKRKGNDLGFGVGVAQGYATLGRIDFGGRFDYASVGSVTNMAARLCAEAKPWQILITQRVNAAVEDRVVTRPVGELTLRGFQQPVPAFEVIELDSARGTS